MRIYSEDPALLLKEVTLVLTPTEMGQLGAYANELVEHASKDFFHCHLNDDDYRQEVTLVIVTEETKVNFHPSVLEILARDPSESRAPSPPPALSWKSLSHWFAAFRSWCNR